MTILLMSASLSLPAAVAAQTEAPEWARKVRRGAIVFVTTSGGESIEGTAGAITGTSMIVATRSGPLTLAMADIAKVQKPDGAGNGALTGALAGLGVGVLVVASRDCANDFLQSLCETVSSAALVGLPLIGAGLGWAIDAGVKGRDTIFDANRAARGGRGTRLTLSIAPRAIRARIAF
ncbi:MAG TPA: hypothetical protein VMN81_05245 [Vicinamibacterales bacterium]|nr:hypothetical protein [Vicinamibacterales bacterium]